MNVRIDLLEFLLDGEPNLESFRRDPWVEQSLRPALRDRLSDGGLFFRLRDEVLHRALIFRQRFLLGENTAHSLEDLIEAESRLVWEGSENIFVPLHQSVARRFEDLRSVNKALERLETLKTGKGVNECLSAACS